MLSESFCRSKATECAQRAVEVRSERLQRECLQDAHDWWVAAQLGARAAARITGRAPSLHAS